MSEKQFLTTVNNDVCRHMQALGCGQVEVNHNGVNYSYVASLPPSEKKYEASFLGRLAPSKGLFDLIKIWRNVVNIIPSAKLMIVGGGDETFVKSVSGAILRSGLEANIELHGFLKENEVYDILRSTKLFLFPSHEEGFGISIAEAMACSLPVVAWDLPVYKEVFPDGLISVEKGNIPLFSEKVIEILKNDKMATEIGKDSRRMASMYDWDKVAEKEFRMIGH